MSEDKQENAKKFIEAALPSIKRADKANRDLLIPALADGQLALVFDAKSQSKQFFASQPAAEKPMPMMEPALVVGLSDAKLFKQALGEYRAIVNGLIDAARQIEDVNRTRECEDFRPAGDRKRAGAIYSFALPDEWGVDKQIVPNIAVSQRVAVISISNGHTERLLKATPLTVGGVLAQPDRPLAVAGWLNWAGPTSHCS